MELVDVEAEVSMGAGGEFDACEFAGVGQCYEYLSVDTQDGARLTCSHPLATKAVAARFLSGGDEHIPPAGSAWAHRRVIGGRFAGARLALHGNDSSTAARLSRGGAARWHRRLLL